MLKRIYQNSGQILRNWLGIRSIAAMLAGAMAFVTALGLVQTSLFDKSNLYLKDWYSYFSQSQPTKQTVLVAIDEKTILELGGWPVLHSDHATVLEKLNKAGARRILLDVAFGRNGRKEHDARLIRVLDKLGPERVAMTSVIMIQRKGFNDEKSVLVKPLDKFSKRVSLVSSDLSYDVDGRIRTLGKSVLGTVSDYPSAAAWLLKGKAARPGVTPVDFGLNSSVIPVISFLDIYKGNFSADQIRGRDIVIGMQAAGMMRQLPVPLYDLMQRGPFLALATETLRLGHETTPIATWRIITLSLCISLFLALLLSRFGAMKGAVITLSLALLLFSLATKLHQSAHLDADPILPFLSIFFTFMAVQITLHPAFHRLRQAAKSAIGKVDMGLARLFHSSVDAIITFSPEGRILTMNTAAENLFGQTAEKCAGAQLSDILPDHAQSLLSAVSQNRPGRMEARENLPERHIPLHMDMTFNTLPSDEGWIGFASIRDISDIKTREEQYKRAATHDAMTGLPNRAAFKKHLEATLMFAQDTRQTFCVFLMDLNKFKAVNDTLGHHIGDELLIEVARRFKAAIRKGDFVARLGGDEFAIVMSAPSAQSDARILAARIIESIAAPLQLEGHDIDVGTSIGISVFPEHANQSDKLLQLADEAMYTAKRGKLGFTFTGTPLLET